MQWPFKRSLPPPRTRLPHARPMAVLNRDENLDPAVYFTCTTCGRSDLGPAGDWDPPICEECDAAINFDAITEEMEHHDEHDEDDDGD